MPNDDEHVERLKEGVDSWNEWRRENDDIAVDLSGAKLEGVDLTIAKLEGANLIRANLKGADLLGAKLEGVNLFDANLERANLTNAKLGGANLTSANLKRADLFEANLERANLRTAKDFRLDGTRIKDSHFSVRATDPWSALRNTYTGPQFTFLLLSLIAFSLPYIGKIGFWSFVNNGQGYTQGLLETIRQRAHTQGIDDQTIAALGLSQEEITSLAQCLNEACDSRSVGQLLLGMDQGGWFWMLPVVLIVYNILRGGLTYLVVPMRDQEERSGYSPLWVVRHNKKWWQGYRMLFYAHRVVFWLGFIALMAFGINAWHWLSQPIYLPM